MTFLEKYLSFGSRTRNRKRSLQVPLPDAKGAIRMKGSERLENGRCKVKASPNRSQRRFSNLVLGEFAVSYLVGRHRVQELQVHIGLWKVIKSLIAISTTKVNILRVVEGLTKLQEISRVGSIQVFFHINCFLVSLI